MKLDIDDLIDSLYKKKRSITEKILELDGEVSLEYSRFFAKKDKILVLNYRIDTLHKSIIEINNHILNFELIKNTGNSSMNITYDRVIEIFANQYD